jgi:hypothetical protein
MIDLSFIRDLVAIFGVIIGFCYYVITVRSAQKNQRIVEETRQIQLITQLGESNSEEAAKRFIELLEMEWNDYDDFEKKYGSDFNRDNYAKRQALWYTYDTIGLLLKKGLIDRNLIFGDMGFHEPLVLWHKFGGVIKEIRRRYNQPYVFINLEYFAEECNKYYQGKGLEATPPDTYWTYVPDQ